MKYLIVAIFMFGSLKGYSQDSLKYRPGNKSFEKAYSAIEFECGSPNNYVGKNLQRRKVKSDLWIVSIVSNAVNGKIGLLEVDSVLKSKGFKPFTRPYNKPGYDATHMIINGEYIVFKIICAVDRNSKEQFIGATLRSNYELFCKSQPLHNIPSVNFDVNFFQKKVIKRLDCPYEIFNEVALGKASYMWNELHFIF